MSSSDECSSLSISSISDSSSIDAQPLLSSQISKSIQAARIREIDTIDISTSALHRYHNPVIDTYSTSQLFDTAQTVKSTYNDPEELLRQLRRKFNLPIQQNDHSSLRPTHRHIPHNENSPVSNSESVIQSPVRPTTNSVATQIQNEQRDSACQTVVSFRSQADEDDLPTPYGNASVKNIIDPTLIVSKSLSESMSSVASSAIERLTFKVVNEELMPSNRNDPGNTTTIHTGDTRAEVRVNTTTWHTPTPSHMDNCIAFIVKQKLRFKHTINAADELVYTTQQSQANKTNQSSDSDLVCRRVNADFTLTTETPIRELLLQRLYAGVK